jgi:hypothetical protein
MLKYFITLVLVVVLLSQVSFAQDIEGSIKSIVEQQSNQYLKSYLQPLSNSLGISLGSALYHRAYTKGFPRFDIGLSAAYIMIPDEAKTFTFNGQEVSTIYGGSDNSGIKSFDKSAFFLPILQANVGLVANLEATARFAAVNVDYMGDLTIYGGGLKYGLSDLLPLPMIDFSVQAMYHKFKLGDFIDAGTFSMNLQTSLSIPVLPIDIYGGLGLDNSTMKVKPSAISGVASDVSDLTIDGENGVHFNLGASWTFLVFNIHADYSIGKYNSIGSGVMIVF